MAEPDRLQPGEPVAAAGAAEENRELVADQLAAAVGEDRRQADQARALLLADAGREPSDAAAIWKHGATARRLAGADRIEEAMGVAKRGDQEVRLGEVFVECAEKTEFPGFGFPGRRKL